MKKKNKHKEKKKKNKWNKIKRPNACALETQNEFGNGAADDNWNAHTNEEKKMITHTS